MESCFHRAQTNRVASHSDKHKSYLHSRTEKGLLSRDKMTFYLLGILSFESSHGDGNQKPEQTYIMKINHALMNVREQTDKMQTLKRGLKVICCQK